MTGTLVAAAHQYVVALALHWRAGITGGFGIAIVTGWTMTGHFVPPRAGAAFVVGTLLVASFDAWREEHRKANALETEVHRAAAEREARTPRIDDVALNISRETFHLTVYVINPGEPTSFIAPFLLDVAKADGTVSRLNGIPSSNQLGTGRYALSVNFGYTADVPDGTVFSTAKLRLSSVDIHNKPVEWETPR
jgi:hypothetical protein